MHDGAQQQEKQNTGPHYQRHQQEVGRLTPGVGPIIQMSLNHCKSGITIKWDSLESSLTLALQHPLHHSLAAGVRSSSVLMSNSASSMA